jgi:hypothetical protein
MNDCASGVCQKGFMVPILKLALVLTLAVKVRGYEYSVYKVALLYTLTG